MTEVKTFKIDQKFSRTEDLYSWIRKNVDSVEEFTNLQIQSPIRNRIFCLTAKEKITERNILFYASKGEFHESLGELIISAGTFDADVIIFFIPDLNKTKLEPLNWLHKICNADTEIIACEADF